MPGAESRAVDVLGAAQPSEGHVMGTSEVCLDCLGLIRLHCEGWGREARWDQEDRKPFSWFRNGVMVFTTSQE